MNNRLGMVVVGVSCFVAAALAGVGLHPSYADSFDWRNVGGQDFVTPIRDQGNTGMCWAFSTVAALESAYKITRNDPLYDPDFSEQQLACAGVGDAVLGGDPIAALVYFRKTGVVSEQELPYTGTNTSPNWPLQSGWQNRVAKIVSYMPNIVADTATAKESLKTYGPFVIGMSVDNDWYNPAPGPYRGAHAVEVVGYQDDSSAPGGGYWIVKNSWGTSWGNAGYGEISYTTMSQKLLDAITGPAYITGAMATASWQGGSGTWSAGNSTSWTSNSSPYAWENKETAAVFSAGGASNAITISGPAIAHTLTFNTGATGYSFSGGSLTTTGGGITANESVTVNSPVTVGAPQTWLTAAGKTLTIGGNVHTVISTLKIDGAGKTVIQGNIDDGGVINSLGAPGGGLVKNGTGVLLLSGANTYSGGTTVNQGMLQAASPAALSGYDSGNVTVNGGTLAVSAGGSGWSAGNIDTLRGAVNWGGGTALGIDTTAGDFPYASSIATPGIGLTKLGSHTLTLSGSNSYTGLTTVAAGTLDLVGSGAQGPVLAGAGADIQGGGMVFDYTGGADPATALRADLAASFHGSSSWVAGQIHSSTAAASPGYYALGWSDDTAHSKVTVQLALAGDVTLDGTVGLDDLGRMLTNFDKTGMSWSQGDVNFDDVVDLTDLSRVLTLFDQTMNAGAMPLATRGMVPEPSSIVLLAALLLVPACAAKRWRR